MNKRRIYKYGTGEEVPEGSIYICTLVENLMGQRLVWHYFLVDVTYE